VLLSLLAMLGGFLLSLSVFGSREAVCRWSDAASSHEVAIILALVAVPLAWAIRRSLHKD